MISAAAIVAVLSINANLGCTDANTCPVSGCIADSADSVSASVLIQQVQHNSLSGPVASVGKPLAKAVVDEALGFPSSPDAETAGHSATPEAMHEKTPTVAVGTQTSASLTPGLAVGPAPKPPSLHMLSMHPRYLPMLQMSSMHHGIARLAANVAPASHGTARGGTALLNADGYQAVAALKSDAEMEMFIRRVIDAYDSKVVNEGGFKGIVPWFSGTTSTQDFKKLQETLLYAVLSRTQNPWLAYKNTDGTTGKNADLSFTGYVEIAAAKSHNEMATFARRVCDMLGVRVVNEPGFHSVVRFYSGEEGVQDFGKLTEEIRSAASSPHSWAEWKSAKGR